MQCFCVAFSPLCILSPRLHRTMADPLLEAKQLLAAAVAPTAAPAAVRPPSPSPSPPF